jgi:putative oxidoreductase
MKLLERLYPVHLFLDRHLKPAVTSLVLLLMRVVWGYGFFLTGSGKLKDIDKPIAFFKELGIPAPVLNAYFVGSLECVGGLLLLMGLCSRPIAFLLTGNMLVAFLTADKVAVHKLFSDADPTPVINAAPFWFFVTSLTVLALGPGKASLDALLVHLSKHKALVTKPGFPVDVPSSAPLSTAQRAAH